MFGSGMGVDGGVGSDVVSEGKKGAKHCKKKKKRGDRRTSARGVAFLGNGVGSVTGQQKEQCPEEKGQKG